MSVDLLPCGSSFTEPSHYPSSLTAQATTASHSRHGSHVSAESDFSIVHSVDLDAFDPESPISPEISTSNMAHMLQNAESHSTMEIESLMAAQSMIWNENTDGERSIPMSPAAQQQQLSVIVDEYEEDEFSEDTKQIRERLFDAQRELVEAEEEMRRAFSKVQQLRSELILSIKSKNINKTKNVFKNTEGEKLMVEGKSMLPKMHKTEKGTHTSSLCVPLLSLPSPSSSSSMIVDTSPRKKYFDSQNQLPSPISESPKIMGTESEENHTIVHNKWGEIFTSSAAVSSPPSIDEEATMIRSDDSTISALHTNESQIGTSDNSNSCNQSRRSSRLRQPSDVGAGESLKIDALTREIDAASLDTRIFRQGIFLFNMSARRGIDYMAHWGFLVKKPMIVAKFLQQTRGLNKAVIGDFLSTRKPFNAKVMRAYFEDLHLEDLRVDDALRAFVGSFRLSGEAGPINYMMETFAYLYKEQNPNAGGDNPDGILVIAYAILMLNTSLHNPSVRTKDRMTLKGFQAQLRDQYLAKETLAEIFKSVKSRQFSLTQEETPEPLQLLYPSYEGFGDKTDWGSEGSSSSNKSKRYFVLSDGILYYFTSRTASTPSAAVLLNGCKVELSIDKLNLVIRHASGGPILVAKRFAWRREFRFQLDSADDGIKWQSMIEKELQFTYT